MYGVGGFRILESGSVLLRWRRCGGSLLLWVFETLSWGFWFGRGGFLLSARGCVWFGFLCSFVWLSLMAGSSRDGSRTTYRCHVAVEAVRTIGFGSRLVITLIAPHFPRVAYSSLLVLARILSYSSNFMSLHCCRIGIL